MVRIIFANKLQFYHHEHSSVPQSILLGVTWASTSNTVEIHLTILTCSFARCLSFALHYLNLRLYDHPGSAKVCVEPSGLDRPVLISDFRTCSY